MRLHFLVLVLVTNTDGQPGIPLEALWPYRRGLSVVTVTWGAWLGANVTAPLPVPPPAIRSSWAQKKEPSHFQIREEKPPVLSKKSRCLLMHSSGFRLDAEGATVVKTEKKVVERLV